MFHLLRLRPGAVLPSLSSVTIHDVISALVAVGRPGVARRVAGDDCSAACAMDALLNGLPAQPGRVRVALRELRRLKSLPRDPGWVKARAWHHTLPVAMLLQLLSAAVLAAPRLLRGKVLVDSGWPTAIAKAAQRDGGWDALKRKHLCSRQLRSLLESTGCRPGAHRLSLHETRQEDRPSAVVAMLWGDGELVEEHRRELHSDEDALKDLERSLQAYALPQCD
jgi:hypothetical protein